MMKKVSKLLAFIFGIFAVALSFLPITLSVSSAASVATTANSTSVKTTLSSILQEYVGYDLRYAGSSGEKQASEYISNYLSNISTLEALNNEYVVDGVQEFQFVSSKTRKYETSQNIIYKLNSTKNNVTKKIIIGCSYDAVCFENGEFVNTEGVNQSAGSVALLLTLASTLSTELDYNIEFVFFGAGQDSQAGSNYYAKSISSSEKENVLLMINFDNISFGKSMYFYVDEFENDLAKELAGLSTSLHLGVSPINTANLMTVQFEEANDLGLFYTHIALNSNNYNFMKSGILALNIFAGDYSSGIVIGRSEFYGEDILTYTKNESLAHYAELYGSAAVLDNLYMVYDFIDHTLTDLDLQTICAKALNQNNMFYAVFANPNLAMYLTIVMFFVFVMVGLFIYHRLTLKAYNANIEEEFVKSVINISENVKVEDEQELPKIVSEIVANDIKKDKAIKHKKK